VVRSKDRAVGRDLTRLDPSELFHIQRLTGGVGWMPQSYPADSKPAGSASRSRNVRVSPLRTRSWDSCDDAALSNASTPPKENMAICQRRWHPTEEDFTIARGVDQRGLMQRQPIPVLDGERLAPLQPLLSTLEQSLPRLYSHQKDAPLDSNPLRSLAHSLDGNPLRCPLMNLHKRWSCLHERWGNSLGQRCTACLPSLSTESTILRG